MHDASSPLPRPAPPFSGDLLAEITDALPVPLCMIDTADRVIGHNAAFRREFPQIARVLGEGPLPVHRLFEGDDLGRLDRFLLLGKDDATITLRLDGEHFASQSVLLRKGEAPRDRGGRWLVMQSFREVDDFTRARSEVPEVTQPEEVTRHRVASIVDRVADALPFALWAIDHEGEVCLWNRAAERLVGLTHHNIRQRGEGCLQSIGIRTQLRSDRSRRLPDPDLESAVRFVTPDGEHRWVRWFTIGESWSIRGWRSWGLGLDVTDQYSAFRALQESERRYRDVLRNVDLAGIMVDEQERVLYLNDHLLRLTGWNELSLLGLPWRRAFAEAGEASIQSEPLARVLSLEPFESRVEGSLRTAAGETRDMVWTQSLFRDVDGRVVGACALGMDVTEQRRAAERLAAHRDHLEELVQQRSVALAESERRLRDAERLAALGRLSAGVSHDMGNMLLPVRCHLDRLHDTPLTEGQRASFAAVRQGIDFLDHLGEGLELLAGDSVPSGDETRRFFHRFEVMDWWTEVRPLFRGMVPEPIAIAERIDADLPEIRMPRHLLTRAIMNLVTNAVEAIANQQGKRGGSYRGRIEFRISRTRDGSVLISVVDNGPGIEDAVLRRAADPFFTTKTRSLSTGLGLSVARGVARMAGGSLELAREGQGGTRASLMLPAFRDPPDHRPQPRRRVSLQIADPRSRAICLAVCESVPCSVLEPGEEGEADYLVRTPADSLPGDRFPQRGTVIVNPTDGIAAVRKALLDAFEQGDTPA